MDGNNTLDISWGTILKIASACLLFYALYLIKDVFVWLIFALVISVLFNPTINFMQKAKVPRFMAAFFAYLVVFGLISVVIYSIVPLFVNEFQNFSQFLPQYFDRMSPFLRGLGFEAFTDINTFLSSLSETLQKIAGNVFSAIFSVFGGIVSTIFIITVAFFISLDERAIEKNLSFLFPENRREKFLSFWEKAQEKVSGWFVSRVIASSFVGLASLAVFLLFSVKYPFSLALLAGVFNFIPVVGPMIVALLIFLLVFFESALQAIFVLIIFFLIQQIENNILTPIISKKFIGLSPVLVLIALAIGGKLWGLLGAILAIPLFSIFFEFIREFIKSRIKEEEIS
ncbi:hypothetical protein BWK69_00670 [Candidatus Parcubacteria bacterium A4]|nr:MAG: hypothetical protein BWK69_00670 [Candidatus Parcubacteria bacterium A4]